MAEQGTPGRDLLRDHLSGYKPLTLKKGQPLLYQGEIPTRVFYIKSGVVKIYNISSAGEEKVVGYDTVGGVLPVSWVFGLAPVSLYYYDTFTECQLYRLSKEEVLNIIQSDPAAGRDMLQRMVSMYMAATTHLHALEQSRARDKLLYIFQYLVIRFGRRLNDKQSQIELQLTHQEIANLIGTTRETVSMEIGKLTKEGIVKYVKKHYIVNNDMAVRQLGEDEFAKLKL